MKQYIAKANSIRGALFALKSHRKEFCGCDIAYEFMVRGKSYVRGDLVSMTTLSKEFTDLYLPGGGPNSDPVLETVDGSSQAFDIDIKKISNDKNSKYYKNKFYAALVRSGRRYFCAYPVQSDWGIGRVILTVFADKKFYNSDRDPKHFSELAGNLHANLRQYGLLAGFFGLDEKEKIALARMANGKTAADIAQEANVTARTIEMRLQSARKKLKAQTTTEAVYKSVAYGILPL